MSIDSWNNQAVECDCHGNGHNNHLNWDWNIPERFDGCVLIFLHLEYSMTKWTIASKISGEVDVVDGTSPVNPKNIAPSLNFPCSNSMIYSFQPWFTELHDARIHDSRLSRQGWASLSLTWNGSIQSRNAKSHSKLSNRHYLVADMHPIAPFVVKFIELLQSYFQESDRSIKKKVASLW